MLFNSYVFIFAFLPVVLAVYAWVRRHPDRRLTIAWLVVASLFYYGWWKSEFLLLLLGSVTVNAVFGKLLCEFTDSPGSPRLVILAPKKGSGFGQCRSGFRRGRGSSCRFAPRVCLGRWPRLAATRSPRPRTSL